MKRIAVLLLLALLLAGCSTGSTTGSGSKASGSGGSPKTPAAASEATGGASSGLKTLTIDAGGKKVGVRVEIADNQQERETGLMGRTALGRDRGMLFVFSREQTLAFWMKDTLIPLSIAYMDSGGRIVDIQDMKPLDDKPPNYVSAKPSKYALEVNKGFFREHGVKVGDRATLP